MGTIGGGRGLLSDLSLGPPERRSVWESSGVQAWASTLESTGWIRVSSRFLTRIVPQLPLFRWLPIRYASLGP